METFSNLLNIDMDFPTFLLVIILIVGPAYFILSRYMTKVRAKILASLENISGFKPSQHFICRDLTSGLAIDASGNKIALIKTKSIRVIDYNDIISCEIFEDGSTVTKSVRTSQIGGMLVGGLVFGGVGALIGGLSGKTRTDNKVKRIDLRLIVNDTSAPLHDINFMDTETNKDGFIYRDHMTKARHWHALMEVAIKRADHEAKAALGLATKPPAVAISIADELKKLVELKNAGALTETEFQTHKGKLLG